MATTAPAISRISTAPPRNSGSSMMVRKLVKPMKWVLTMPKTPPTRSLVNPTQMPVTIG